MTGEIGVFVRDRLVGSGYLSGGKCGIAIRGDDPTTEDIDGALEGESFHIAMLNETGSIELEISQLQGETVFNKDAITVLHASSDTNLPTDPTLISAYPNPFNSTVTIKYKLVEAAEVNLAVFDVNGHRLESLHSGLPNAGVHNVTWNAIDMPSGLYFARIEADGKVDMIKMSLVR